MDAADLPFTGEKLLFCVTGPESEIKGCCVFLTLCPRIPSAVDLSGVLRRRRWNLTETRLCAKLIVLFTLVGFGLYSKHDTVISFSVASVLFIFIRK